MNTIVCFTDIMKKYKKISWNEKPVKTIIQSQIEIWNRLVAPVIAQSKVVETNTTKSSIWNDIGVAYHGAKSNRFPNNY